MTDLWSYLSHTEKPIVLYGTGNGADKILDQLSSLSIPVRGIFASSGFVRNRTFRGFPVQSYEELLSQFPDMIVLLCFGSSRKEVIENVDRIAEHNEVYAPDVPVYGRTLFDSTFYRGHADEFSKVREMLQDDLSIDTFDRVIRYKLTGDHTLLRPCEAPPEEICSLLSLPEPASYIDLGAYNGDTVTSYSKLFPRIRDILAVEPDRRNYRKLCETVHALYGPEESNEASSLPETRSFSDGSTAVSCVRALISDHDGDAYIPRNRGRGVHETADAGNTEELTAISLVTLLSDRKADLIKMDVEGNEKAAIEGGRTILLRDRPALIVSCYHRSEDLFTLPLLVKEIVPDYKVYMRHHPHLLCWDTEFIFV